VEFSGLSPDSSLVEIMEYRHHPWFVACQFHPEFKSKPMKAHPLFRGFVKAVLLAKAGAGKGRKNKTVRAAKKARTATAGA